MCVRTSRTETLGQGPSLYPRVQSTVLEWLLVTDGEEAGTGARIAIKFSLFQDLVWSCDILVFM